MFAITKAERDRRRYIRSVRNLLIATLKLTSDEFREQNRRWEEWLGLKRQDYRDLCGLLKGDVNDAFKARAIAIMIAPRFKLAPFAWSDNTSLDSYLFMQGDVVLADLSPRLRDFTLALLEINIDIALVSVAEEYLNRAALYYNGLILQALALLGEDDLRAARLFGRYHINDPVPFWSFDDASDYNPILKIFGAEVPEKWKRLADEKMRGVIRAEQEGRTQPRRPYEEALSNYIDHIESSLYGEKFPYSPELLASQVEFILGLPKIDGRELFNSWHVGTILRMLIGDKHKDLRHRFARNVILADHGKNETYHALTQATLAGAQMMLQEFGEMDAELRDRLKVIIAEGQARERENEAYAQAHQSHANNVMAAMR